MTDDCSICFEPLAVGEVQTLGCAHVFHQTCAAQWRAGTCPLCRRPYTVPRGPRAQETVRERLERIYGNIDRQIMLPPRHREPPRLVQIVRGDVELNFEYVPVTPRERLVRQYSDLARDIAREMMLPADDAFFSSLAGLRSEEGQEIPRAMRAP